MPISRKQQIDLSATPYYHCISRCVRQAFLCGKSRESNKNYEHRREWVASRLTELAEIFAIKTCAYAIMSNHYHVVLYIDVSAAKTWTADEVITRWTRLFKGATSIIDECKSHQGQNGIDTADAYVAKWRKQLTDISWFMRCLNEYLARRANFEDGCKGRFWEGRYKSQALLDESALLTCMAYVDLNPVRAKMSDNLEESDFTSIQQRVIEQDKAKKKNKSSATLPLMDFQKQLTQGKVDADIAALSKPAIPFYETNYIELVRWTGTAIRGDKKGHIPASIKTILNENGINEKKWLQLVSTFGGNYSWLVGGVDAIKQRCAALNKKWLQGLSASFIYFASNTA